MVLVRAMCVCVCVCVYESTVCVCAYVVCSSHNRRRSRLCDPGVHEQ